MHLEYPLQETLMSFKSVDILVSITRPKVYLVGKDKSDSKFSLLRIRTLSGRPLKDIVYSVEKDLSKEQLEIELSKVSSDPSKLTVIKTQGILGFTKFLQGYYLLYIESSDKVAKIGRHKLRMVRKTGILPLFELQDTDTKAAERKYIEILRSYRLENFYFSYTYDLTNSLHWNLSTNAQRLNILGTQPSLSQSESMYGFCEVFQWNYNLLKEFEEVVQMRQWVMPVIHGFCKHMNIRTRGCQFSVVIVSRRSRHHAGTRYLKRGINQDGFVANFVETEQVVVKASSLIRPSCSSFIQVRGSAPVYWMQQPSLVNPKPAIELISSDPMFLSTKKHFGDLISLYGRHIFCVNLMKVVENSPRETILSEEYREAINLINQELETVQADNRIHYMQTDFKANQKINKHVFIQKIKSLAYYCIQKTGLFLCDSVSRGTVERVQLQNGVIRANCVDCLDRTNSFQQLVGETALAIQVAKLLGEDINLMTLKKDLSIFKEHGSIFQEMGDLISIQYGSSLAHKQQLNKTESSRFQFMTSMTRHFNNTFSDSERQQQIDVFLKVLDPFDCNIWDIKPTITLFPSQAIRQRVTKYWEKRAYGCFNLQQNIKGLEQFNKVADIISEEVQLLRRHDLVIIFSNEVAEEMYTDSEERLRFCISIPEKLDPRKWALLDIKPPTNRKLEDKLSLAYNKPASCQDRVLEEQTIEKQEDLGFSITEGSQIIHSIINPPIQSILVIESAPEIVSNVGFFDEAEIEESINTYLSENVVTDEMVSNDVILASNYSYEPDLEVSYGTLATEEEIKSISKKIISNNFLSQHHVGETFKGSPERRRTMNSIRIVRVEDKKAEVLEEVIKRNFSHGCQVGRVRII